MPLAHYLAIDLKGRDHSWRDDASNLDEWQACDRAWRKRRGWRAGLTFWRKSNVPGRRSLIARHWPHRLCWQWGIDVGLWRVTHDGPRRVSLHIMRRFRYAKICLLWFYADFHWQDSDWMCAVDRKADAPTIYWKHHLQHAEAAGSA